MKFCTIFILLTVICLAPAKLNSPQLCRNVASQYLTQNTVLVINDPIYTPKSQGIPGHADGHFNLIYARGLLTLLCLLITCKPRGMARGFQRWVVTLFQKEGTHQVVMSFLLPVVGCLLEKSLQKQRSQPPYDPPGYTLKPSSINNYCVLNFAVNHLSRTLRKQKFPSTG